jgi:hypothetical protein
VHFQSAFCVFNGPLCKRDMLQSVSNRNLATTARKCPMGLRPGRRPTNEDENAVGFSREFPMALRATQGDENRVHRYPNGWGEWKRS